MSRLATVDKAGERAGYQIVKTLPMRRSLVLTDETARHPFLASLPPHVRGHAPIVASRPAWAISQDDVRGFVSAYFACLVAVAIFIV
jgi:hypothetical protein